MKNQISRRNLNDFQRIEIAHKCEDTVKAQAKKRQATSTGGVNPQLREKFPKAEFSRATDELGELAGVSRKTYEHAVKVIKEAPEELKQVVRKGEMSINQAYHRIKNAEREQDLERQREEIEEGNFAVPSGLFDVIAIDPAWKYGTEYSEEFRRCANPYPEMTQEELKAIELSAAENCAWPHSAGNFISPCSFSHSLTIFSQILLNSVFKERSR